MFSHCFSTENPFLVYFSIFWPSKYPYFDPIFTNFWNFQISQNIFVGALAYPLWPPGGWNFVDMFLLDKRSFT